VPDIVYKLWRKAKTPETERVNKLLTTMLPSLPAPLIAREYTHPRELLDDARTVEDRKNDVAFSFNVIMRRASAMQYKPGSRKWHQD
jgi:hypothetical protein